MTNIKIISVEAKRGYYLVTTSKNDYKFDEDTIVKYEVFNDKEFSDDEFKKVIKYNDEQLALNKAIRYLGYGPRSRLEIIKYLKEKGIDDYKSVLKKLTSYGYIDDEKLAKDLFEYYIAQNKGPLYILKKLDERGIDEKIVSDAKKVYTKDLELSLCLEVANKEINRLKVYPLKKQKSMLYAKLVSKGYSSDVIRHTLDKTSLVDESDENLKKDYEKLKAKANKKELDQNEMKSFIIERLLAKGYEYKSIKNIIEL